MNQPTLLFAVETTGLTAQDEMLEIALWSNFGAWLNGRHYVTLLKCAGQATLSPPVVRAHTENGLLADYASAKLVSLANLKACLLQDVRNAGFQGQIIGYTWNRCTDPVVEANFPELMRVCGMVLDFRTVYAAQHGGYPIGCRRAAAKVKKMVEVLGGKQEKTNA